MYFKLGLIRLDLVKLKPNIWKVNLGRMRVSCKSFSHTESFFMGATIVVGNFCSFLYVILSLLLEC